MLSQCVQLDILGVCVKITTGTGSDDGGNVIVRMDEIIKANDTFGRETIVFDSCISELKTITFHNPTSDAWAGNIVITVDGVSPTIVCPACTGGPFSGSIVVDGDSDSADQSNTQCFDGSTCEITWAALGGISKIYIS